MSEIVLFVGLPGSGKTYYANKMCDLVIDDISDISQLPSFIGNKTVGITDVNFCDERILKKAKEILNSRYEVNIEVIYFANDPEKCRNNVEYRNDGRNVEGTIRRFEKIYNPPYAINIWQTN
jgi:tRNA uridine 5-carbamoylmethylation protein Kti12